MPPTSRNLSGSPSITSKTLSPGRGASRHYGALGGAKNNDKIDLTDLKKYVEAKVPQYARGMKNACIVERGQQYCQKPLVDLPSRDYPLVPRYTKILAKLNAGAPLIPTRPTHVVIAVADLLAQARGTEAKSQLQPGTLVTLIKADGEWAYVAYDGKPLGYVLSNQLAELKAPGGPRSSP
jgi:hypothetical protein